MRARVAKPEHKHHSFRLISDGARGEILIVGTGERAYLWAGETHNERLNGATTYSGPVMLRKFAYAILRNVKPRKRKKT